MAEIFKQQESMKNFKEARMTCKRYLGQLSVSVVCYRTVSQKAFTIHVSAYLIIILYYLKTDGDCEPAVFQEFLHAVFFVWRCFWCCCEVEILFTLHRLWDHCDGSLMSGTKIKHCCRSLEDNGHFYTTSRTAMASLHNSGASITSVFSIGISWSLVIFLLVKENFVKWPSHGTERRAKCWL